MNTNLPVRRSSLAFDALGLKSIPKSERDIEIALGDSTIMIGQFQQEKVHKVHKLESFSKAELFIQTQSLNFRIGKDKEWTDFVDKNCKSKTELGLPDATLLFYRKGWNWRNTCGW